MEMLTLRVLAESSTRCAKRGANNTIATIVVIGQRHSEGILICTPRSVVHTSTGGVNSHALKCMTFRQNAIIFSMYMADVFQGLFISRRRQNAELALSNGLAHAFADEAFAVRGAFN